MEDNGDKTEVNVTIKEGTSNTSLNNDRDSAEESKADNTDTPCTYCKRILVNGTRKTKGWIQCDSCDWIHAECFEKYHKWFGHTIYIPKALIDYLYDEEIEYSYCCNKCVSDSVPLPIQLLQQRIMSKEQLDDFYKNSKVSLRTINQYCSDYELDFSDELEQSSLHQPESDNKFLYGLFGDGQETEIKRDSRDQNVDTRSSNENTRNIDSSSPFFKEFFDFLKQERDERRAEREAYEQRTQELISGLKNMLPSHSGSAQVGTVTGGTVSRNQDKICKLPKLTIPEFSGALIDWKPYWDLFSSVIHTNSNVPTIEKFHYLRNSLSGEAKKAIEGLQVTTENYSSAISILEKGLGTQTK